MAFRTWIISRHPGALQLLAELGIYGLCCAHLDIDHVVAGDVVIGTLPVHLIAKLCERDIEYWHISLNLRAIDRGQELTVDQMKALGVRIERFKVQNVNSHAI